MSTTYERKIFLFPIHIGHTFSCGYTLKFLINEQGGYVVFLVLSNIVTTGLANQGPSGPDWTTKIFQTGPNGPGPDLPEKNVMKRCKKHARF